MADERILEESLFDKRTAEVVIAEFNKVLLYFFTIFPLFLVSQVFTWKIYI